jgi:L-ribulokinase
LTIAKRFKEEGVPVKDLIGMAALQKISFHYANDGRCNEYAYTYSQIRTNMRFGCSNVVTVTGIFEKVKDAMNAMGQGFDAEYYPNQTMHKFMQNDTSNTKG